MRRKQKSESQSQPSTKAQRPILDLNEEKAYLSRDADALNTVLLANSYKNILPWIDSTGFQTHELRYRTLGHCRAPRVAEEFLLGSRLYRYDRSAQMSVAPYFLDAGQLTVSLIDQEDSRDAQIVTLPSSVPTQRALEDVVRQRRSRRSYTGDPLKLAHLATIIRSAAGVTGEAQLRLSDNSKARVRFRAVASGGGLYPVEVYLASLSVRDLEPGLYRYQPLRDVLIREGDGPDIRSCCAGPEDLKNLRRAGAVILLIAQPWRSMRKYGSRGLRFIFIEAGAMTQNIHLMTEALGLGSVDCGSFCDDEVHEAIAVDGVFKTFLHAVMIGDPE